jgi:hypothetical protein
VLVSTESAVCAEHLEACVRPCRPCVQALPLCGHHVGTVPCPTSSIALGLHSGFKAVRRLEVLLPVVLDSDRHGFPHAPPISSATMRQEILSLDECSQAPPAL